MIISKLKRLILLSTVLDSNNTISQSKDLFPVQYNVLINIFLSRIYKYLKQKQVLFKIPAGLLDLPNFQWHHSSDGREPGDGSFS